MKWSYKEEIRRRLYGLYHLKPIFTDVYNIAERVYRYDPSFFLVFNTRNQRYEVHCLEHIGSTYAFPVANNRLDARVLDKLWEQDLRMRGKDIFTEIYKSEEDHKKRQEREWRNKIRDIASETKSAFAETAWTI